MKPAHLEPRKYDDLIPLITRERLGSYLRARNDDIDHAFALYEWNMRAAASVMELTSMIEVITRNALDRELRSWALRRHPATTWFDDVPLDERGREDVRRARSRATRQGRREEVHGRVIAELSLGFWRYLVESRYLTTVWIPATHSAFPEGPHDLRERQRAVAFRMQQLNFVRNRAAHHEPIHGRDLIKDLRAAIDLARWISPAAETWVAATTSLAVVVSAKPA